VPLSDAVLHVQLLSTKCNMFYIHRPAAANGLWSSKVWSMAQCIVNVLDDCIVRNWCQIPAGICLIDMVMPSRTVFFVHECGSRFVIECTANACCSSFGIGVMSSQWCSCTIALAELHSLLTTVVDINCHRCRTWVPLNQTLCYGA